VGVCRADKAIHTLLPFAHTAIDRPSGAIGSALGFIGDLIWLVLAEWGLALGHRIAALGLAVTIIGIPSPGRISSLPAFRDRTRASRN
jgi:uncharacterized membrane protein YccF (DUF307 family)